MSASSRSVSFHALPILLGSVGSIFVGRVAIIEFIALSWLILLGGYKKIHVLFNRQFAFVGLFFISALFLLISDIINDSSIDVLIKGVGAYLLLPTTVVFLISCFTKSQIWAVLLASTIINVFYGSDVVEYGFTQDTFKFGFSMASVMAILTFSFALQSFRSLRFNSTWLISTIAAVSLGLLGLWGNLRLLTLCAFVAYIIYQVGPRLNLNDKSYSHKRLILSIIIFPLLILFLSIFANIVFNALINLVPYGLINQDALDKTIRQGDGNLGVIFGGRSEIFSAILAWLEKPILGWGSWSRDPGNYFTLAGMDLMNKFGYEVDIELIANNLIRYGSDVLIPSHSVLLNTLVWAGIFGMLPLYVFVIQYALNLVACAHNKSFFSYPYLYLGTLSLWSILFSPFGYTNRLFLSLVISAVLSHFASAFFNSHCRTAGDINVT